MAMEEEKQKPDCHWFKLVCASILIGLGEPSLFHLVHARPMRVRNPI
jgi:hypothetical protein